MSLVYRNSGYNFTLYFNTLYTIYKMTFKEQIQQGIPIELPNVKPY